MTWILWAAILLLQNISFTLVSRARNSASLGRHVRAAVLSNGIWFVSQCFLFTQMFAWLKGDAGLGKQIFVGLFYTTFTIIGSVAAHKYALATEKGKSAVGASAQYAQIPVAEWEEIKARLQTTEEIIYEELYADYDAQEEIPSGRDRG